MFGEAEYRLGLGGDLSAGEWAGLEEALAVLTGDGAFSPEAAAALKTAAGAFNRGKALRRPLNTVRHILLAETGRSPADWDLVGPEGSLDPQRRRPFPGMIVYLEDIRSPFNVGAMFRTAESFGAERLLLSPLCADPLHPRASRTAMGCVEVLPWERLAFPAAPSDTEDAAARSLSRMLPGPIFALETGGTGIDRFPFPSRGVLIVGSEELGVSPGALAAAEASLGRLSIPTWGAKGSLNVSVAFGIAMAAWAFQITKK
jgi:TrmH family RNA methyltransferase